MPIKSFSVVRLFLKEFLFIYYKIYKISQNKNNKS